MEGGVLPSAMMDLLLIERLSCDIPDDYQSSVSKAVKETES